MDLTCPKCQGAMRQYERSGVHVDQCSECRGIFLDRGELERLVDAEAAFASRSAAPPPAQQYSQPPGHAQPEYSQYGYAQQGHPQHGGYRHKKRKSFFDELFD
jgi:Zn-finger nucleic acid-binding protein